jgi:hypothetical protein
MDENDEGRVAAVMEERRREALVAFLWAGMSGTPDKGVIVERLADARRAVVMHHERGLPPDRWLADEVRVRGIRENAAVLAALEVPAWREQAAEIYRREHPDRVTVLDEFLAAFDRGLRTDP